MKILGFGLNGMVGTRVVTLLKDVYEFENVSRSTGVNIIDQNQVLQKISTSDASIIFNFAAKTNVDTCEKDKPMGENGEAWKINVEGVRNLVLACRKTGKKLLHISTDFVYDGDNTPLKGYAEDDSMNPINWYGVTKARADEIILEANIPFLILRPAFPYTFLDHEKHFVSAMYSRFANNQPLVGITDEKFTPTWIDDIARAIDILLQRNAMGIYNTGGTQITPYTAALKIAEIFAFDKSLLLATSREKYFSDKAKRPFNTSLNCGKLSQLGLKMTSFEEGINKIKNKSH